jgi:hypothetical protein
MTSLRGVAITGLSIKRAFKRLDGTAITSGTWTIYVTKDGGTQATLAGSVTHEGNGQWTFNVTAAERDAQVTSLWYTHPDAAPWGEDIISAPVLSGTAQAGASTTITLASTASATDDIYKDSTIVLGDGQERFITGYVGATKVATVHLPWASNPTSSTAYYLLAAGVNVRTIAGQTANAAAAVTFPASIGTSTLDANGVWSHGTRILTAGTNIALAKGTGVTGFNDITAASVWGVARSGNQTSGTFGEYIDASIASRLASASYVAAPSAGAVADQVWDEARADHAAAGSFGEALDAKVSERATPDQVNAQVLDVLTVDTFAEPSAVPPANASLKDKLGWVFSYFRNKLVQTATLQTLRNDGDDASIATAAISNDNGTGTTTRNEWTS